MKKIILIISLFVACAFVYSQKSGETYYVDAAKLNLRSEPNVSCVIVQTLSTSQAVFIQSEPVNNWVKIKVGSSIGYVHIDYITKNKVETYKKQATITPRYRIGATCNDGTSSNATGRGACSHHGGVASWRYNR